MMFGRAQDPARPGGFLHGRPVGGAGRHGQHGSRFRQERHPDDLRPGWEEVRGGGAVRGQGGTPPICHSEAERIEFMGEESS